MKLIISIILMTLSLNIQASENKEILSDFFSLLENKQYKDAVYLSFKPHLHLHPSDEERIKKYAEKFEEVVSQLGKNYGCEIVTQNNLINRYKTIVYLCLYEVQPLKLQFELYRPNKDWRIHMFSYRNSVDDIIDKAIEQDIIKSIHDK